MITSLHAAFLGLWLAFLYVRVVRRRFKYRVSLGGGGQEDLQRAIRVHGNFVETVPYALILMVLVETSAMPEWVLHGLGVALVAGRLLNFDGLSQNRKIPRSRQVAGILTLSVIIISSVILLWQALPGIF